MSARLGRNVVAAMLLSLGLAGAASAAEGAMPQLAIVDVQKVLSEASASKQARQAIEDRRLGYERDLDAQKQQLKTGQAQLEKQRAVLAPEALEQRRRELEQRYNDVRRQTEERRALLQEATKAAMSQLRQEMGTAIAEVMKAKGVELTLPRSAVLIFDNRLDITAEVVQLLNKRLPKVELNLN